MTFSSFAAITSVPINIVRFAMRPFAHGATAEKLRLQHNLQSCLFRPLTPVSWQPDNALALDPCAAHPDLIFDRGVPLKLARIAGIDNSDHREPRRNSCEVPILPGCGTRHGQATAGQHQRAPDRGSPTRLGLPCETGPVTKKLSRAADARLHQQLRDGAVLSQPAVRGPGGCRPTPLAYPARAATRGGAEAGVDCILASAPASGFPCNARVAGLCASIPARRSSSRYSLALPRD